MYFEGRAKRIGLGEGGKKQRAEKDPKGLAQSNEEWQSLRELGRLMGVALSRVRSSVPEVK